MAVNTIRIGFTQQYQEVDDSQLEIGDVVAMIHNYLSIAHKHWFYISLGRGLYKNCCRSWARILPILIEYKGNPQKYYSTLMISIENEIAKFAPNTFYAQQLLLLKKLIKNSPALLSLTQTCK